MKTHRIDRVDVQLQSPADWPRSSEEELYGAAIDALAARLATAGATTPTLLAPSLREGIAIAIAAGARREQPVFLATDLSAPAPLLLEAHAGERSVVAAGALATAFVEGGICVLADTGLSEPTARALLPVLAGARSIDVPSLGLALEAHPDARICVVHGAELGSSAPAYLAAALQAPVMARLASEDATATWLKARLRDISEALPESASEALARLMVKAAGRAPSVSLYEAEDLARLLAEPRRAWTRDDMTAAVREMLGPDAARIAADEKLLEAFREVEANEELDALKRELGD